MSAAYGTKGLRKTDAGGWHGRGLPLHGQLESSSRQRHEVCTYSRHRFLPGTVKSKGNISRNNRSLDGMSQARLVTSQHLQAEVKQETEISLPTPGFPSAATCVRRCRAALCSLNWTMHRRWRCCWRRTLTPWPCPRCRTLQRRTSKTRCASRSFVSENQSRHLRSNLNTRFVYLFCDLRDRRTRAHRDVTCTGRVLVRCELRASFCRLICARPRSKSCFKGKNSEQHGRSTF